MRQLAQDDYRRIKALFRRLVKLSGGLCEAAEITRYEKSRLSDFQNPHHSAFPPADVIADLEAEVGEALVSRELVRLVGELNLEGPLPQDGDFNQLGRRILIELAELESEFERRFEDGSLCERDLEVMEKEAGDVLAAARHYHDAVCRLRAARRETAKLDGPKPVRAA